MTRNHAATIYGAPAPPDGPRTPKPRALVYTEAGRVEVFLVAATDGLILDPGDARLLAAALTLAAGDAGPTEAEHRAAFGWDAAEDGAAFDAELEAELEGTPVGCECPTDRRPLEYAPTTGDHPPVLCLSCGERVYGLSDAEATDVLPAGR